jgi:hypothetical protein
MVSYPAVVSTTCALAVGYVAYIVFYRLYLHPLAKYPGPFWAKISDLPSYWYTRKQDRHVWLLKLQQQYGMSTTQSFSNPPTNAHANGLQDLFSDTAQMRSS